MNKKICCYFPLLIFIFLCSQITAQFAPSDILHERYWYYRTRLNNDFLKVGINQGESMPIPERNLYTDPTQNNAPCGYFEDELILMEPLCVFQNYSVVKK
ncbi:MAG: hypothetical protein JST67_07880 [Bacteroidetes bacterium]|nr:hypothetical protein [Bacteroidota bacterium]